MLSVLAWLQHIAKLQKILATRMKFLSCTLFYGSNDHNKRQKCRQLQPEMGSATLKVAPLPLLALKRSVTIAQRRPQKFFQEGASDVSIIYWINKTLQLQPGFC